MSAMYLTEKKLTNHFFKIKKKFQIFYINNYYYFEIKNLL